MKQSSVDLYENIICEERATKYRGTACVRIESLEFGLEGSRQVDRQNIERLRRIFKTEGCYRLEPENRIPAVISQRALRDAIHLSGTTLDALLRIPQTSPPSLKFPPGFRLQCLKGRSRAKAAEQALRSEDRWWGIDLYLEDSRSELRRSLMENFSNSSNFCDGEVYLKICHYRKAKRRSDDASHRFAEKNWWARLSNNKQDNLMRLFKDKKKEYRQAFDSLLAIPGVWSGFRISRLKDLFGLRCQEQIVHYLSAILDVFSTILGGDLELMKLTDRRTVELLQLRVPGKCSSDRKYLRKLFENGDLFPAINIEECRQRIWNNLLTIDVLIPTLYTLFEDIKYIKPCATIMNRLLAGKRGESIQQGMEEAYSGANQEDGEVLVQEIDGSLNSYRGGVQERVTLGIFQLWLFAARNFASMVKESPRKEDGEPMPKPEPPDASLWCSFATLASKLGFESDAIHELKNNDPDKEIARAMLLEARKEDRFKYDDAAFESFQQEIVAMFATAEEMACEPEPLTFYTDGRGEDIERRCGRAFERAYRSDRRCLFLDAVLSMSDGGGNGITSLFVRISVFRAFFGKPTFNMESANFVRGPFELSALANDSQQGDRMLWQNERSELRKENERKTRQIMALEHDLSQSRREVVEFRQRNDALERTITQFNGLTAEKAKIDQQLSQIQNQVINTQQDAQRQILNLQTENGGLRQEILNLQTYSNTLKEQIQVLENNLSQTQHQSTQFSELFTEKAKLEQQISHIQNELGTMKAENEGLRKHMRDVQEDSEQHPEHNTREGALEEEVGRLKSQLHDLSKLNGQAQDRIKGLQQKNENSETTILDLKARLNRLEEERTFILQKESNLMRQERDLLQRYNESAVAQDLAQTQEELKNTKAEHEALKSRIDSENQNHIMQNNKLQEEIAQLQNKLQAESAVAQDLAQTQEELKNTKAEHEALKSQIDNENQNHTMQNNKLQEEITQLQNKLQAGSAVAQDLAQTQEELKNTKAEYETLRKQTKSEEQSHITEKDQLQKEIKELQLQKATYEALTQRNTSLEADLFAIRAENSNLKEQIRKLRTEANSTFTAELNYWDQRKADQLMLEATIREVQDQTATSEEIPKPIHFQYYENGSFRETTAPLTPSQLERIATKFVRKRRPLYLYTSDRKAITPANAFEKIKNNNTYTIVLIPEGETVDGRIDQLPSSEAQVERRKRAAVFKHPEPRLPRSDFAGISSVPQIHIEPPQVSSNVIAAEEERPTKRRG